ncbi:hypothetical protein HY418_00480 [Candidatus Kaiserbacteria bacterium]|nr:hypothetical protein [Candidatus Kaiserbacteria bacterium]
MKSNKDLFRKIILWTYYRQDEGFFWVELENEFSLTPDQKEWALKILRSNMPISENLIDHLRFDNSTNADKWFITSKGVAIARSYMDARNWYEKSIGLIVMGVFIGVLATVIGGYILFRLGWM